MHAAFNPWLFKPEIRAISWSNQNSLARALSI